MVLNARFNSIKVRLRPKQNEILALDNLAFQFHKGTIKTFVRKR